MKKGDEMGKSASKPTAYYRRNADPPIAIPPVPPIPPTDAPFFNCPGAGKTKRFAVIVGSTVSSDGDVSFTVKRVRNGVPSTMKTWTQGNWVANMTVEIGTDEIEVEDDDVFTMSISGLGPAKILPDLLVFVVVELG